MSNTSDHTQRYIDNAAQLHEFCTHLQQQTYFTIDTEFVREQTYYPKLCLIQIATESEIACIDPLAIDDLSPLFTVLTSPDIVKIFHAARQDIEAFYYLFQDCPRPVFDTQIAASLVGFPDQIGYANLVERLLGVQLDKKHTRADWSKRPLSEPQLQYAADDVRYLYQLYPMIIDKLKQHQREDWLQADFDQLTNVDTYKVDYDNLWKKVAGQQKLKRQQLTILSELAKWREQTAQNRNRPRKWILSDDTLITLSINAPQSMDELNAIRLSKNSLSDKQKNTLVAIIKNAMAIPKEQWLEIPKFQKLSTEQNCIVDALMCVARSFCAKNSIALASVTTRKELEKLVSLPNAEIPVLKGWRYQTIGNQLEAFLASKTRIEMLNDELSIEQI